MFLFQKLQGEIDEEDKNFLSLTDNTKRTLSCMKANNEDTAALKYKLEEMNGRWNYLKAMSTDIK